MLENQGGAGFLGEPRLELKDLMAVDAGGMGRVNVLMADRLTQSPRLYAMFLLWLLSELFEELPEVGDPDKPVLVFFFDEAHLLFNDAPKALVDKVDAGGAADPLQGCRRLFHHPESGRYSRDVLAQLGNRVQHALRAFTPRDAKALRAAAETFRPNPEFDTETAIREVGTGEAVVSLLEAKGVPAMVSRTLIRPPESRLGPITAAERAERMAASPLAGRYDTARLRELAERDPGRRAEVKARDAARPRRCWSRRGADGRQRKTARRYEPTRATRTQPSMGAELARTVVKQLGTRQGQAMVSGILGGLFKGAEAGSGPPGEEVGDQPQPGRLALLRVELGADQVVAADHRGDRAAVIDGGEAVRRVVRNQVVGVHEIGVVAGGDAGEHRVAARRSPARSSPCAAPSAPGRRARCAPPRRGSSRSPGCRPCSRPTVAIICRPTQMPRNGAPSAIARASIASNMPGTAARPARQSAKAPTPGSTMRSARAHGVGVGGDDHRAAADLGGHALEALLAECRLPLA